MGEYSEEVSIAYYNCDKSGHIRLASLLEYLIETSSLHSDSLGLGYDEMLKRNYAWILSRWKIKIYKYPKARDKIKIKTWISRFDKFYANREFAVYDSNKQLIAKASTLWVFMNTRRKRPVRIPAEIYDKTEILDKKNFHEFLEYDKDYNNQRSMDFRVRKTDIDYNNHVNNIRYVDWFLEIVELEIEEKYFLEELDIYYRKEVKYDSIIESRISTKEIKEGKIEFFHEIYNKDIEELTTLARSVWKKS